LQPEGFPPPPVVNQELAKFASLSIGDPKATITKKNREQYKEYMRQKLLYEQWENGLILYKKRLADGNSAACQMIVNRLTVELSPQSSELTDSGSITSSSAGSAPASAHTSTGSLAIIPIRTSSSEPVIEISESQESDKRNKKKRSTKDSKLERSEKDKRKSAKTVKMLSGVGNRSRSGSEATTAEKKKEKKLVSSGTVLLSSKDADESPLTS